MRIDMWTVKENDFLKQHFPEANMLNNKEKFLNNFPNRTWEAIKVQANKLGIHSKYNVPPHGNVSKLLEETPEAYYWAGFIAADGHIEKDKRLSLKISSKDREHLIKFAAFLGSPTIHESIDKGSELVDISIQDHILVPSFAKKFDFGQRKTYNPPNLAWLEGDKFLAFFAGYIDGDGCIHKNVNNLTTILISCHSNWLNNLKMFEEKLYRILQYKSNYKRQGAKIIKCGKASITFGESSLLKLFKLRLLKLKLPVMHRKWDNINEHFISRQERGRINKKEVLKLRKFGDAAEEIASELNIPVNTVRQWIYESKL